MKILVVDDEDNIRELIRFNLNKEGFDVAEAATAADAVRLARDERPALIALDLMLPDMSGLDVCRILKSDTEVKDIPIIMVTAKGDERDIIAGLDLGADDYITKPFSPRVLLSRVKSVLRRCEGAPAGGGEITAAGVTINSARREAAANGKPIELSATEFDILELLARNAGQVFSRKKIINSVKGSDYPVTDRSIDVQILGIRRKLEAAGAADVIETMRGVGYRLRDE